jgi:hypothetical protein
MENTAVYMVLRGRRVEEWVRRGSDQPTCAPNKCNIFCTKHLI